VSVYEGAFEQWEQHTDENFLKRLAVGRQWYRYRAVAEKDKKKVYLSLTSVY
jgi:hypothetical protein